MLSLVKQNGFVRESQGALFCGTTTSATISTTPITTATVVALWYCDNK